MKKPALTPGLEDVMLRLMSCRNFEPNPVFKKARAKKARKTETERMKIMIFLLAGIVGICGVIALAEGIVWIWEKMDPPAEVEEVRVHGHTHRAIR